MLGRYEGAVTSSVGKFKRLRYEIGACSTIVSWIGALMRVFLPCFPDGGSGDGKSAGDSWKRRDLDQVAASDDRLRRQPGCYSGYHWRGRMAAHRYDAHLLSSVTWLMIDRSCITDSQNKSCKALTGKLSLRCARSTADGWQLMWVNRPTKPLLHPPGWNP